MKAEAKGRSSGIAGQNIAVRKTTLRVS